MANILLKFQGKNTFHISLKIYLGIILMKQVKSLYNKKSLRNYTVNALEDGKISHSH